MKKNKQATPARITPGTRPDWRPILEACCEVLGVKPDDIIAGNKSPYMADRRHIIYKELWGAGYSSREVGIMLNRADSTVRTGTTAYYKYYRYDPGFRAMARAAEAAVEALLITENVVL